MRLTAEHIKKSYGSKQVLRDISFYGAGGECIGILGANGCGKSTLLSILAGVQASDGGSFRIDGKEILGRKGRGEEAISYIPQGTPLMEELTAKDHLRLWYCRSSLDYKKELQTGMLAMLGIGDFLNVPVKKMSGGMKKRLSIGCAIANDPSVIIMDEPSAALDLIGKERIHTYIRSFKEQGGIVLLATHEEQEINLCDRLYIMKDGILTEHTYGGNIHRLAGMLV